MDSRGYEIVRNDGEKAVISLDSGCFNFHFMDEDDEEIEEEIDLIE